MKRAHLLVIRPDAGGPEAPEPGEGAPPLVHLRITGRHGVFLVQQGAGAEAPALVDTRAPGGVRCTCPQGVAGDECSHIDLLRACGFLPQAA